MSPDTHTQKSNHIFTKDDFAQRGYEKRITQMQTKTKKVLQGEIWIAKIGVNIGSEIGKEHPFVRPVLVLQTNCGGDLVYIIPMSTQYTESKSLSYKFFHDRDTYGINKETYLVLNQARYISRKRLVRKINNITRTKKNIPLVGKEYCHKILQDIFLYITKNAQ